MRICSHAGILLALGAAMMCPLRAEPLGFSRLWPATPPPGMVLVPAGKFIMGATSGLANAAPKHAATLGAYYIDRCEVSNEQYEAFVAATRHRLPAPAEPGEAADWDERGIRPGHERLPVCEVDWADAEAYARWAGKRLPSEEEWEKAARGADGRIYPWGNELDKSRCNHDTDGPTQVGSFPEGAGPSGCLDMAGNVCEWTASLYRRYPGNPPEDDYENDEGYSDAYRVFRGGTWDGDCSYSLRCYARVGGDPLNRLSSTGFRCALSAPALDAFEGVLLPERITPAEGRALIEAVARAVPGWSGRPEDVSIAAADAGQYTVTLPLPGRRCPYALRCTASGVWVAEGL